MEPSQKLPTSSYLQYLPSILQDPQKSDTLNGLLLAFEDILSGSNQSITTNNSSDSQIIKVINDDPTNANLLGLEDIINQLNGFFDPSKTPDEFLPWLAGWVALSLRDDWSSQTRRAFVKQAIKFYRLRGTKAGLTEILDLYLYNSGLSTTRTNVKIEDEFDNFPYFFQVTVKLNKRDQVGYYKQANIAKAIIDQQKPAHTYYALKILMPSMMITKSWESWQQVQQSPIKDPAPAAWQNVLQITSKNSEDGTFSQKTPGTIPTLLGTTEYPENN